MLSIATGAGYKAKVRGMVEKRDKGALSRKVEEEEHPRIYAGLGEGTGVKTHLHG